MNSAQSKQVRRWARVRAGVYQSGSYTILRNQETSWRSHAKAGYGQVTTWDVCTTSPVHLLRAHLPTLAAAKAWVEENR